MFASQQGHRLSQLLVAGAVCAALARYTRAVTADCTRGFDLLVTGNGVLCI